MRDTEKLREYQRKWTAERRKLFFSDKSCVKCGSVDRLELDHVNPVQKVSHRIWSWSIKRREEEIAKCQVLCYSCHKKKTSAEATKNQPCGSIVRYEKGCRCELCRKTKSLALKRHREKLKSRNIELDA